MAEYPIGYLVKRVRLLVRQRMDRVLAEHELTAAWYEVLFHLHEGGAQSSAALARSAGVTPQTMHRQVQRLLQSGLIRPLDGPGRSIRVELTERGREAFVAARAEVLQIETDMTHGLDDGEVAELGRLLRHCERRLAG